MVALRFRPIRAVFALLVAALTLAGAACDKVALTAPTQSTITLFANSTVVPLNGSAEIVATVLEQAGTAVQNGTLVTFTTNLGTIEPREARTQDGKATVRFVSGTASGTARIGAFSGAAKATEVELKVGGAAASRVLLNVSPGTVPAGGGTVTVTATVTDENGNRLPGVPVTFTSSAGTLLNGTVLTDGSGEARTTLTTNRDAQITATAGGQQAQVSVTVNPPIGLSITAPSQSPAVGQAATFTVSVTGQSNAAPLRNVQVDFGDGSVVDLGTPSGSVTLSHVYRTAGTFTVRATASNTAGETTTASTQVTVVPSGRPLVALSVPATAPANSVFTASVSISQNATNLPVESVTFNFGDGNVKVVNSLQATHAYGAPGNYNVRATVRFADGTTSTAEAGIRVTAS
jgi:PKD repeat protein